MKTKLDKDQLANLKAFCRSERQTEILEAVILCGSLRKAAKELGVNPGNISRAIHRIERNAYYQNFSNDPAHAMIHQCMGNFQIKAYSASRRAKESTKERIDFFKNSRFHALKVWLERSN